MNASILRAALRNPGPAFLWVPEIGTYIVVVKSSLRDALDEFIAEGETLDAQVNVEPDAIFIEDLGAREALIP